MKRAFLINFRSAYMRGDFADEPCPKCGERACRTAMVHPEPYIINPPYKRTPEIYKQRIEIKSLACLKCDWRKTEDDFEEEERAG